MKKFIVLLFALSTLAASGQLSAAGSVAFSKGSTTLGVVAGSGRAFDDDYIILGVGAGYYLINGLELGIDIQQWFSGDPSITKVSPQIKYVFTQAGAVKPYLGGFYRRTYIEDLEDTNSYGYRAGAYFSSSNRVYIGGGVVYETYEDCSRFVDCSNTYPEVLITIGI